MDALVPSPVHTTKDTHYTTLLPNIVIYDMNASALVGYRGDQKQCTSVQPLLLSRQKRGGKTEKSQIGLKTANICQNLLFRIQNI